MLNSDPKTGFACPNCKRPLAVAEQSLICQLCGIQYPVVEQIPDFLVDASPAILRLAKRADTIAPIYESPIWYQLLLNLAGARGASLESIAAFHATALQDVSGLVLDVACGTATYGRRLASNSRIIYGVDISLGMLRRGMNYLAKEGISGVQLARASVDQLPFRDGQFDGVICSGSLHLFPDTTASLYEIARTMKPGAPLSVQTFVAGNTFINRLLRRMREVHTFEMPYIERCLSDAGFEQFEPVLRGIFLTFRVRKPL
jgi:SAM-dependent methyltransferase